MTEQVVPCSWCVTADCSAKRLPVCDVCLLTAPQKDCRSLRGVTRQIPIQTRADTDTCRDRHVEIQARGDKTPKHRYRHQETDTDTAVERVVFGCTVGRPRIALVTGEHHSTKPLFFFFFSFYSLEEGVDVGAGGRRVVGGRKRVVGGRCGGGCGGWRIDMTGTRSCA